MPEWFETMVWICLAVVLLFATLSVMFSMSVVAKLMDAKAELQFAAVRESEARAESMRIDSIQKAHRGS